MAEINSLSVTDASNIARFPEQQSPSSLNNGARALEGMIGRWSKDISGSLASTGSSNAYALAINRGDFAASSTYDGYMLAFQANHANTGAATLNVTPSGASAIGTKAIKKANDQDLASGDIESGQVVLVCYDNSTDTFQMLSQLGNAPLIDPMTTRGDILVRNSSNVTARLAVGAAGTALVSDGTDPAYAGIIKQGTHTISIPAGAWKPATTAGCAALAQHEGSNSTYDYLAFDASSDEHATCQIAMPESWNEGTVTFQVEHTTTATDTDGVAWGLQAVATSDGDALDVSWGTAVVVTDAYEATAHDNYKTAVSSAITIAGSPAAKDLVRFRIFRDVSDAADTAAEDARLIAVRIFYTVNAADDA